jgi:hypothetical protein
MEGTGANKKVINSIPASSQHKMEQTFHLVLGTAIIIFLKKNV